MIERHVTFDVRPGKEGEFAAFFQGRYRPAMARTPGYLSAELLRPQDGEGKVMMVLRFESPQAAAAWRASEAHARLKPDLRALYTESHLEVYQVLVPREGSP
jgi:heme-degrading monooxygenase HmoA